MRVHRLLALAACALTLLGLPARSEDAKGSVRIRWFGQACFELSFAGGPSVLCDPFDAARIGEYAFPRDVQPDVVTVSHEHFDHSNDKAVAGTPRVLRGLTSADAATHDWQKHDVVVKGVRIRTVGVYHDDEHGKARGKNAVFVFEPESPGAFPRVAHLGDLGHALTDEQVKAIGPLDVLLVPVGGTFTIDAKAARAVCDQLRPRRVIVPMHYKTAALSPSVPLATADDFLAAFPKERITRGDDLVVTPGADAREGEPSVFVLGYRRRAAEDGSMKLELGTVHAWVDSMPGRGGRAPALLVKGRLDATADATGGTLEVKAKLSTGGGVELEQDDGEPLAAIKLAPGASRSLRFVAKEGQTASDGATVEVEARLVNAKGVATTRTASVRLQETR